MNNRERVLAALQHRQPDRTPFNLGFTQPAHHKMVEFYKDADFEQRLGNCFTILSTEPEQSWREVRPHVWEDQFGVRWDRHVDPDIGVVANTLVNLRSLDQFTFPDTSLASPFDTYTQVIGNNPANFVVANLGFSLFERAWTLTGIENLLVWMISEKAFVHRLLDCILEFNLAVIARACEHPIDAMMFGDDWGQQTSLIMGPRLWREFIKPRVQQMYSLVKSKRKYVFIHSCGKVDSVFPDLIECGLDCFNPFQPEVMDIFEIKDHFGDRLSFYGGISTQRTLPFGTPQQVKDEVKRLIERVGKDGGLIASPAHAIPADARAENIHAMIDVLQNQ
jgi:uroporphyrinogen decarboxylase